MSTHGGTKAIVAAKIEVPGAATAGEVAQAIDDAEQRVRAAVPHASLIYLEPDLRHSVAQAD